MKSYEISPVFSSLLIFFQKKKSTKTWLWDGDIKIDYLSMLLTAKFGCV